MLAFAASVICIGAFMEAMSTFEDLLFDISNDFTIYTQSFMEDESVKILNDFNPLIFGNYQKVRDKLNFIKDFYKNSNLKKYHNKVLSHNDASLAYRGESISLKIKAPDVESLIELIGNLFFLIKYKSGVSDVNAAIDPLITLPFDKNGAAFINKPIKQD